MKFSKFKIGLLAVTICFLFSCKKDPAPTPEEVITTVEWTFKNVATSNIVTFVLEDLDGDGGQNPSIDTIKLAKNTIYEASVRFLDKTKTPIDDITTEVAAESDVHLVTFSAATGGLQIEYLDQDGNGKPVGLKTKLTTGAAGANAWTLILHHEPTDKNSLSNPGGETDVEATFPVIID
jgi:hypothetical protein